jgi:hypothetical protein
MEKAIKIYTENSFATIPLTIFISGLLMVQLGADRVIAYGSMFVLMSALISLPSAAFALMVARNFKAKLLCFLLSAIPFLFIVWKVAFAMD